MPQSTVTVTGGVRVKTVTGTQPPSPARCATGPPRYACRWAAASYSACCALMVATAASTTPDFSAARYAVLAGRNSYACSEAFAAISCRAGGRAGGGGPTVLSAGGGLDKSPAQRQLLLDRPPRAASLPRHDPPP